MILIQSLRNKLSEYEHSFTYLMSKFSVEKPEIKALRAFLAERKDRQPQYRLNNTEYLELLTLAVMNSTSSFIKEIRRLINLEEDECPRIRYQLGFRLLTPDNVVTIQSLSSENRALIEKLYYFAVGSDVFPNIEKFNAVVKLVKSARITEEDSFYIEQCFKLLNDNQVPLAAYTDLFISAVHRIDLPFLHDIMMVLSANGSLNPATMSHLHSHSTHLYIVAKMISLLRSPEVRLMPALFSAILRCQALPAATVVVESCLTLKGMSRETIIDILSDTDKLSALYTVIPVLKEFELLNDTIFAKVCLTIQLHFLQKIIKLLSHSTNSNSIPLLISSKNFLSQYIRGTCDLEKCYIAIEFLAKCNNLSLSNLNLMFSELQKPADKRQETIWRLFESLIQPNIMTFDFSQIELAMLFKLPDVKLNYICHAMMKLANKQCVSGDSFKQAIYKITNKTHPVTLTPVVKVSRKRNMSSASELIIGNKFSIFMKHSSTQKGGCGKVRKGYKNATDAYVIKKLIDRNHTPDHKISEIKREVKYHRLFGREAYCFVRGDKYYLVYEWQQGKPLINMSRVELMITPLDVRLRCLIKGFKQLDILHKMMRVHHDVKCDNWILDLDKEELKLIDFGGTHKTTTKKPFVMTKRYFDHQSKGVLVDLFGMSICIAYLFPEIFTINKTKDNIVITNKVSPTPLEYALEKLVWSLRTPKSDRCTSAEAKNYCEQITTAFKKLTMRDVENIANSTITPTTPSAERILRAL